MTALRTLTRKALQEREAFKSPAEDLQACYSKGGTYIISTMGQYADDHTPHDLLVTLWASRFDEVIVPTRPNVDRALANTIAEIMNVSIDWSASR